MAGTNRAGHTENGEVVASGGLLKKAAQAIGSVVGIAVSKTGIAHSQAHHPRIVNGRFQQSHKHRLPRKLKKRQKKEQQAGLAAQRDSE